MSEEKKNVFQKKNSNFPPFLFTLLLFAIPARSHEAYEVPDQDLSNYSDKEGYSFLGHYTENMSRYFGILTIAVLIYHIFFSKDQKIEYQINSNVKKDEKDILSLKSRLLANKKILQTCKNQFNEFLKAANPKDIDPINLWINKFNQRLNCIEAELKFLENLKSFAEKNKIQEIEKNLVLDKQNIFQEVEHIKLDIAKSHNEFKRVKQKTNSINEHFKKLYLRLQKIKSQNIPDELNDLYIIINDKLQDRLLKLKNEIESFEKYNYPIKLLDVRSEFSDDIVNQHLKEYGDSVDQLEKKSNTIKDICSIKARFKKILVEVYKIKPEKEKFDFAIGSFSIPALTNLTKIMYSLTNDDEIKSTQANIHKISQKQALLNAIQKKINSLTADSSKLDIIQINAALDSCDDFETRQLLIETHPLPSKIVSLKQSTYSHDSPAAFFKMSEQLTKSPSHPITTQKIKEKPQKTVPKERKTKKAPQSIPKRLVKKTKNTLRKDNEQKNSFFESNLDYSVNLTHNVNRIAHSKGGIFDIFPDVSIQAMLGTMLFVSGTLSASLKNTMAGRNLSAIHHNLKHNRGLIDVYDSPTDIRKAFELFCDQVQMMQKNKKDSDAFTEKFLKDDPILNQLMKPKTLDARRNFASEKEESITKIIEKFETTREEMDEIYSDSADAWLIKTLANDFIESIASDNIGPHAIDPKHIDYDTTHSDRKLSDIRSEGNKKRHSLHYLQDLEMAYRKKNKTDERDTLTTETATDLIAVRAFSSGPFSQTTTATSSTSTCSSTVTSTQLQH